MQLLCCAVPNGDISLHINIVIEPYIAGQESIDVLAAE